MFRGRVSCVFSRGTCPCAPSTCCICNFTTTALMTSFSRLLLVAAVIATLACTSCGDIHPAAALQPQHGHVSEQQPSGLSTTAGVNGDSSLQPPVWPEQFKSVMFQNRTNRLALVTLYYDWRLKANLNIISSQLGAQGTVWDLEWNNGTSFIFSRDQPVCKTLHFDVGILTPDWLKDSKYLGQTATDNFVTNVWTKAKFINYYADKDSGRPVRWTFLWSGAEFHTMEWDEGTTLPNNMWQAPDYCFTAPTPDEPAGAASILDNPIATGRMMRLDAGQDVEQRVRQLQLQATERAAGKLSSS